MNHWSARSERTNSMSGVLFRRTMLSKSLVVIRRPAIWQIVSRGRHRLAYAGLYMLLVLMYVRPQEIKPAWFGPMRLTMIVAMVTILIYIISKINAGERIMSWPLEMKMMVVMWAMGLLLASVAVSPQASFDVLFDPFIKTLLVSVLLINLVDTRARLRSLFLALAFCGSLFALNAVKNYLTGDYGQAFGSRIAGWGVMLSNPNDLASVLDIMVPFVVLFVMTKHGWTRLFFIACASLMAAAVLLTYSRSGFIGLVVACGTLVWKLARGHRAKVLFAAMAVAVVLLMSMPDAYWVRLSTIFNPEADKSTSAQERQMLMKNAADLALKRPIVGVGIGNFHLYSYRKKPAHNSFLETAAELGIIGLFAYLVLIIAPLRTLWRIERETAPNGVRPEAEIHIISVCLQASFFAYIVYGFFGSIQYLYFLYFSVAYTVALRQIHSAEARAAAGAGARTEAPESRAQVELPKGVLWTPRRLKQRLLIEGRR